MTHVILTHCHADHDAGTFQKILLEDRVTVVTTRTIMASFLRKYALVTGVPAEYLSRLFIFLPVKIAEPMRFQVRRRPPFLVITLLKTILHSPTAVPCPHPARCSCCASACSSGFCSSACRFCQLLSCFLS